MDDIAILKQQYEMVCGSRGVVLNFAELHFNGQLQTPVPLFNNSSIGYLLTHNAVMYIHWLANFAMKHNSPYPNEADYNSVSSIRDLYSTVDKLVSDFLDQYNGRLTNKIEGVTQSGYVSSTPLQLFTHVITHEYHHKGQILSMFRLLGQTPPDTDVIRF